MLDLSPLEDAVLRKFADCGGARLEPLRSQLADCHVADRELTGVGFWTKVSVHDRSGAMPLLGQRKLTGVGADIAGLRHGAGFVLYVADGIMQELEGFSYDEPWPDVVLEFRVFCEETGIRGLES